MADEPSEQTQFLRWSDYVPSTDVQDPLGLALRGSARLGSRLLYCITSITPRARYFSFLPWCVLNYKKKEQGRGYALGLSDAIELREHALTLGCVLHHEGRPCAGGALIGSRAAQRWAREHEGRVNIAKLDFAKNPALSAYFNSLVNLGFFVTTEEAIDSDDAHEDREITFDDLELSDLGARLATLYDKAVSALPATGSISSAARSSTFDLLAEFGKQGGLCEVALAKAPDRELLRQIFFNSVRTPGASHETRRASLLLILELCRQLGAKDRNLTEAAFKEATYWGTTTEEGTSTSIALQPSLQDIATRWRMFYFHHYMSVALEALFAWLVCELSPKGLQGARLQDIVARLGERSVQRDLAELLGIKLNTPFSRLTPADLFAAVGVSSSSIRTGDNGFDTKVPSVHRCSEQHLESLIRSNDYLRSPTGFALALVLLATTLGRFERWQNTNYGNWIASAVNDPYVDLLPPSLLTGLSQRFRDWRSTLWSDLAQHLLSRFVIRHHITISYDKTATGDRCLLQDEGQRITASGVFDVVGMGNVRFGSAMQVLEDLALIARDEDRIYRLTQDGRTYLKKELAEGAAREVS